MMIYIYEIWKESLVFLLHENDILIDNDNALFILITDVRQSLFFGWIEQKLSGNGSYNCCGMSDLLNYH